MNTFKTITTAIFGILLFHFSFAQINLKPGIGLESLPSDNDSIPFPGVYVDMSRTFENTGIKKGDTIPHFRLYDVNGQEYDIENILKTNKPCLLIEGSYTCDIFRSRLPLIDSLRNEYGNKINIFIIYTAEAHPDSPDVCPYMGMIWEVDTNIALGINYRQPVTYGQRKQLVTTLLNDNRFIVNVPVLIDGPQNKFWKAFNTAPNSAFLIHPDGTVFARHGWFNGFIGPKYNIRNDLNQLLTILSLNDNTLSENNNFRIYPMPAIDLTQLKLHLNQPAFLNIQLINTNGQIKKEIYQKFNSGENQMNFELTDLKSGVYYIIIKGNGVNAVEKIVVVP